MKRLILIASAVIGCILLPLTSHAAPQLCEMPGGDIDACTTFTSPPSYPALFKVHVCVDGSDEITVKNSSYCARGSKHYECIVGQQFVDGTAECYPLPSNDLASIPDYIMPTDGCLTHEVDGEYECASLSSTDVCCNSDTTSCKPKSPGRTCPSTRPHKRDVCTAPDGSTAAPSGGPGPNDDGDCPSGYIPVKNLFGVTIDCWMDIDIEGDGDGDGDGGGGCPGS